MKKSFKKIVILFSSLVFLSVPIVDTTTNAFAATKIARTTRNKFKKKKTKYFLINGIKISEAGLLQKISHAKITYMADNIDDIIKNKVTHSKDTKISTRFAPAIAAVATVPGLGEVVMTTAGVIIIGGVIVKTGSFLYKKCIQLFSKKQSKIKRRSKNSARFEAKQKARRKTVGHRKVKRHTEQKHQEAEKRRNKKDKKKAKKGWRNDK